MRAGCSRLTPSPSPSPSRSLTRKRDAGIMRSCSCVVMLRFGFKVATAPCAYSIVTDALARGTGTGSLTFPQLISRSSSSLLSLAALSRRESAEGESDSPS